MDREPTQVIDHTRLSADDAYLRSPPIQSYTSEASDGNGGIMRSHSRRVRGHHRHRSRSRRSKNETFKKLLWVKHSFPDNYTDEETFLDHLQRNPRMQRYEFWPLVADSTVIVQQVCAVIVFVCCFSGIIQDRVSPVTVVSTGTTFTVLGWFLWDQWCVREEASKPKHGESGHSEDAEENGVPKEPDDTAVGLGLNIAHNRDNSSASLKLQDHSRNISMNSVKSLKLNAGSEPATSPPSASPKAPAGPFSPHPGVLALDVATSQWSTRNQQRIATLKSALLIYCALLGLSPILKSLTKSTASDSIWAIAFWLMCINIFFFDYGGGVGDIFPASLSTNAALMASTVLASRLPSTTHVFSLTLFSIEVFGLFPVFRRYLRHVSKRGHTLLTWAMVMSAGGGTVSMFTNGGWTPAVLGVILGLLATGIAMGAASYWLISLQVYKNEIHGPWDPARPIIRRRWD